MAATAPHDATAATKADPTFIPWPGAVHTGRLVRRYKRFFADVELDGRGPVTAHTPNTGAMTGLSDPGQRVLVTHRPEPGRKLAWSLEAVFAGQSWVGTNTYLPNRLVRLAIESGRIPDLDGYAGVRPEAPFSTGPGRVDLLLSGHESQPDAWVEVKSVTLREGERAAWPDAVSERGRRHLSALRAEVGRGHRGVLVFLVQRTDARVFAPAADVDPHYAAALYDAYEAGVEIIPLVAAVDRSGVWIDRRLPFEFVPLRGRG